MTFARTTIFRTHVDKDLIFSDDMSVEYIRQYQAKFYRKLGDLSQY